MRKTIGMLIAACAAVMIFATAPVEAQQRHYSSAAPQRSAPGTFVRAPVNAVEYAAPVPAVPYSQAIVPANGPMCTWAPASFVCGQETCFTACMTPEEWASCSGTWYASGYDPRYTAPAGATPRNAVRFYGRCGTWCAPMGSPRLAFWYEPRWLRDGSWHPGRWIVFPFSPSRNGSW